MINFCSKFHWSYNEYLEDIFFLPKINLISNTEFVFAFRKTKDLHSVSKQKLFRQIPKIEGDLVMV
jgi:hypothetical protein